MVDHRDRGLQYGDGLFETMRVNARRIRLLDYHLDRLADGCRRLEIRAPSAAQLRRELRRAAAEHDESIVKLTVTRGSGSRGYRPTGSERVTRIVSVHALPRVLANAHSPARVRICAHPLSTNPSLAGLKTLNRLDAVMARSEWRDERIWEGLMLDVDGNWVCGTMSNVFLKRGITIVTPLLDRCGVTGIVRRWILENIPLLRLRSEVRRVAWQDFKSAEEVFMSNAVVGIRSVRSIERARSKTLRFASTEAADRLRAQLQLL